MVAETWDMGHGQRAFHSRIQLLIYSLRQIWCLAEKASEEDGNQPAREIHMRLLRQEHGQAAFGRYLALPWVQEDNRGRSLGRLVSRMSVTIWVRGWSNSCLLVGRQQQLLLGQLSVGYERLQRYNFRV